MSNDKPAPSERFTCGAFHREDGCNDGCPCLCHTKEPSPAPAPAPSERCWKCRHSRPHHEWPDGKCRAAADTDNECCECVEYEAQPPAPAPSGVLTREEYRTQLLYGCTAAGCGGDYPPCTNCGLLLAHFDAAEAEVERLLAREENLDSELAEAEARADKAEAEVREMWKCKSFGGVMKLAAQRDIAEAQRDALLKALREIAEKWPEQRSASAEDIAAAALAGEKP